MKQYLVLYYMPSLDAREKIEEINEDGDIHLYIFIYVMYDGTAMMMKKMEIRKVL